MRNEVLNRLLASRRSAAREAEQIISADNITQEFVEEHLRRYILFKYMLADAAPGTDNIEELAEISLSKTVKIDRSLIKEFDQAASCDGATSAMAKMVLLFMAIQKDLEIKFCPADIADVETIHQLSGLVTKELQKRSTA